MKMKTTAAILLCIAAAVPAALGQVLQINGQFQGAASGYNPVPGWTLTSGGGRARVLPLRRRKACVLELSGSLKHSQSAFSDLYPVTANTVCIAAVVNGNGPVIIGYEIFDRARRRVGGENASFRTVRLRELRIRKDFLLTSPHAKYIRIVLTAPARTTVMFQDVGAELKMTQVAAPVPPAPVVAAPPPPPPAATPAPPPPAAAPAPPPPPPAAPGYRILKSKYYAWNNLGNQEFFQVTLPRGSEISFSLQEFPRRRLFWSAASADSRYCHVHVRHEQAGRIPHRVENANIRLKAVWRGQSDVVLVCGSKKAVIRVICP